MEDLIALTSNLELGLSDDFWLMPLAEIPSFSHVYKSLNLSVYFLRYSFLKLLFRKCNAGRKLGHLQLSYDCKNPITPFDLNFVYYL